MCSCTLRWGNPQAMTDSYLSHGLIMNNGLIKSQLRPHQDILRYSKHSNRCFGNNASYQVVKIFKLDRENESSGNIY